MWIHHHRLCSSSTELVSLVGTPINLWSWYHTRIRSWGCLKQELMPLRTQDRRMMCTKRLICSSCFHFIISFSTNSLNIYIVYNVNIYHNIYICTYIYIYSCCNWMAIWQSPTCARVPSKWHHKAIVQRAMLRLLHCRARTTWLLWRCRGWFHTSPRHNGGLAGNETKRCWPYGWRLIITTTF